MTRSRSAWTVARLSTVTFARNAAEGSKTTPSSAPSMRMVASSSRKAAARRLRLSLRRSGVTSRSKVTMSEPCMAAAMPPTTTNLTRWRRKVARISSGSNATVGHRSASGQSELGNAHRILEARRGVEAQIAHQCRFVHFDEFELDLDAQPHGGEHFEDAVVRRNARAILDTRDGRLRSAGHLGDFALAQMAQLARLAQQGAGS